MTFNLLMSLGRAGLKRRLDLVILERQEHVSSGNKGWPQRKGALWGRSPPQAAQPHTSQMPLPLLRVSVGRRSPWCIPRISRQIPNTRMKHVVKSYSGHDYTAQHPKAFLSPFQFLSWGL